MKKNKSMPGSKGFKHKYRNQRRRPISTNTERRLRARLRGATDEIKVTTARAYVLRGELDEKLVELSKDRKSNAELSYELGSANGLIASLRMAAVNARLVIEEVRLKARDLNRKNVPIGEIAYHLTVNLDRLDELLCAMTSGIDMTNGAAPSTLSPQPVTPKNDRSN